MEASGPQSRKKSRPGPQMLEVLMLPKASRKGGNKRPAGQVWPSPGTRQPLSESTPPPEGPVGVGVCVRTGSLTPGLPSTRRLEVNSWEHVLGAVFLHVLPPSADLPSSGRPAGHQSTARKVSLGLQTLASVPSGQMQLLELPLLAVKVWAAHGSLSLAIAWGPLSCLTGAGGLLEGQASSPGAALHCERYRPGAGAPQRWWWGIWVTGGPRGPYGPGSCCQRAELRAPSRSESSP